MAVLRVSVALENRVNVTAACLRIRKTERGKHLAGKRGNGRSTARFPLPAAPVRRAGFVTSPERCFVAYPGLRGVEVISRSNDSRYLM